MCILEVVAIPSGDMLVTVSTKFFGKKVRIKIWYLALKKIAYFWFPQGMIIFPGGCATKMEFPEGRGSIL